MNQLGGGGDAAELQAALAQIQMMQGGMGGGSEVLPLDTNPALLYMQSLMPWNTVDLSLNQVHQAFEQIDMAQFDGQGGQEQDEGDDAE
jgi:hypothetical protein